MKKNLLNAALLGLLIATPACSFVSCKDYDDDFKGVKNRLDNLEGARASLNTEITNLKAALEEAKKKAEGAEGFGYNTKAELDAAVANLSKAFADIAALDTRIKVLETAKASLESANTANAEEIAKIKTQLSAIGSKAATFLASANLDEIATLPEKVKNSETALATYKAEVEKRIKALEGKGTTAGTTTGGEALDLTKLNEAVTALAGYSAELEKLKNGTYQTKEQVDKAIADAVEALKKGNGSSSLNLLQTGEVTSIGFRPYDFVDGIESLIHTVYEYDVWSVEAADANGVATLQDFHVAKDKQAIAEFAWNGAGKSDAEKYSSRREYTGERGSGVLAADSSNVVVYAEAEYDFNPSNAKVNLDAKNFSFSLLNSNLRFTRATEAPSFTVTKAEQLKNGVVRVAYTTNSDRFALASSTTAVMASLSYTETDDASKATRVVQSDYKRVVARHLSDFMIGRVSTDSEIDEKGTTLADYLASPAYYSTDDVTTPHRKNLVFQVPNTGEVVKLAEQVATYAPEEAIYLSDFHIARVDQNAATESQLKRAGFHYEYALVKENAKDKSTDAFEINPKTGELKAKFDARAPFKNVGATASVRVTLISPKGEVAAVGYFTAKVAAQAQVITLTSDDALKYACDGDIDGIKFNLKNLNDSLSKLYKTEVNVFNDNDQHAFHFETAEHNGPISIQYALKDGIATEVDEHTSALEVNYGKANAEYPFGVITLNDLLRKNAKINKVGDSYETYVKLVKNVNGKNNFFYVRLLWTPKEVQAAPTVAFIGTQKAAMWHKTPGLEENHVRVHADIVEDPKAATTPAKYHHVKIEKDLRAGFLPVENAALVTKVDEKTYPGFQASVKHVFEFIEPRVKEATDINGNVYTLGYEKAETLGGDSYLTATLIKEAAYKYSVSQYKDPIKDAPAVGKATRIAKLTAAGVVTYLENDVAKDLLNKYSAKELNDGQSITGRVAYNTYDACGKLVKTTGNNEFDVKFLRPLNVKEQLIKTFTDAYLLKQSSGSQDFHKAPWLTDYRDYTVGQNDKQEQLFDTYQVTVTFAPKDLWLTDFSGDVKTFKEINAYKNFELDFEALTGAGAIAVPANHAKKDEPYTYVIDKGHYRGSFTYTSLTANVKEFNIWIPAVIEYKWGTVPTRFKFVVKPTINQAQARRK